MKSTLVWLGYRISPRVIDKLDAVIDYLDCGLWLSEHGFATVPRVSGRTEVFETILAVVAREPVLYLEFGVAAGESFRFWSERLTHPDACLHGFDSFEGLPEAWSRDHPRGRFAGAPPEIADPRARFYVGWFTDTLPGYVPPPHGRLVANVDCDLYSSTTTVLDALERLLVPGSYLYFDEFHDRQHERRAFGEFLDRTGSSFRPVVASSDLNHIVFMRV